MHHGAHRHQRTLPLPYPAPHRYPAGIAQASPKKDILPRCTLPAHVIAQVLYCKLQDLYFSELVTDAHTPVAC